jgi:hypothetical protein
MPRCAVARAFSTGPLPKKICRSNFSSKRTHKLNPNDPRRLINNTIALYSSPLQRARNFGAEALTEIDALNLLLDASRCRPRRQTPDRVWFIDWFVACQRRKPPPIPSRNQGRKIGCRATARHPSLTLSQHSRIQEPLDTPEAIYALYGAEMRNFDR